MTILVTGGLGTIGAPLAEALRQQGHRVIVCDLVHDVNEYAFSIVDCPGIRTYVRCDVGEYRQVERVFTQLGPFDMVYHCAAEFGRWNGEDFTEQLWRTNVIGTKNLLRMQERYPFKLVHFSSSEVYGDWPRVMVETVMDEYAVRQMNDYAMTKWVNEMQIQNAGAEAVIVRLFNTYGPGEYYSPYRSVNCRFLYCALHGLPWTVYHGHQRTSTYVDDVVRTLVMLTERFRPGAVYNIGGARCHTIEELAETVISITHCDPGLILYKDPEPHTTKAKLVDTSLSFAELGHRTTVRLEEGMQLTLDWMRKVYAQS